MSVHVCVCVCVRVGQRLIARRARTLELAHVRFRAASWSNARAPARLDERAQRQLAGIVIRRPSGAHKQRARPD